MNGNAYVYEFSHRPSFSNETAAVHGDDLYFTLGLGLLQNSSRGRYMSLQGLSVNKPPTRALFTTDEIALTQNVITYWTNFAKSG